MVEINKEDIKEVLYSIYYGTFNDNLGYYLTNQDKYFKAMMILAKLYGEQVSTYSFNAGFIHDKVLNELDITEDEIENLY